MINLHQNKLTKNFKMIKNDIAAKSHLAHENNWNSLIHQKERRFFMLKHHDSVAYFLNTLTLDLLQPFLQSNSSWLTVGDYNGFEAQYLIQKGQAPIASDISDIFLKEAQLQGYIHAYQKENVEYLSLASESMDYVSCREAFHHFPRAYLGAYEMIRVAKKAAILIEPIDILSKMPLLLLIKNFCDLINPLLINKLWKNRFSWETVGNYVFKISEREVEKMAMGIGLPCIAFKEINVIINITEDTMTTPINGSILRKKKRKLAIMNFFCKLRLIPYNMLCSVVFKEMPTENVLADMKKMGYKIIKLPENPYLK